MKLVGEFKRKAINESGNLEITIEVAGYHSKMIAQDLKKEIQYRFDITEIKSKRSSEQNKLLWKIIHEIDLARNSSSNNEMDIYIEALERASASFEYIACTPLAEKMLKEQFRAVKFLKKIDDKLNGYKVFLGSSKMDVQEMNKLIETVKDMASESGVEVDEIDFPR